MKAEFIIGLEEIAARHRFKLDELRQPGRHSAAHTLARTECFEYLRGRGWSTPKIGSFFRRDHTTVLWALLPPEERARRGAIKVAAKRQRAERAQNPSSQAA